MIQRNWASVTNGATITGNGLTTGNVDRDRNLAALIDDTEATNWARTGRVPSVAGAAVIVDLNAQRTLRSMRVSALLRPTNASDPEGDTAAQNRFTALRSFEILTCREQAGVTCDLPGQFTLLYTSPADAFPGSAPRPTAPDLIIRTFDTPDVQATHVMLRVLSNQCTGNPAFHVEDADPLNVSNCPNGSAQDETVRVAELEVFSR